MDDTPTESQRESLAEMGLRLESLVQQLARTATQLEAVLDAVENGIIMLDTDFVVRFFNDKLASWFSVPAERVVGKTLQEITEILKPHVQDQEMFEQSIREIVQHPEKTLRDELVIVSPSYRVLRRFGTPVYDKDGHLLGRLMVFSDVTEYRRLEHLRDEFLSVAAHEFKTPITVIKGYAELLLQRPPHAEAPREKKALETINRQADRINRLVQDLLEISRVQMGQLFLRKERFDLAQLTSEMVRRMVSAAPRHQFVEHIPSPAFVDADRVRVQQVIHDLLDNAIKYSPQGGQIDVTVRSADDAAEVSVRDHGIGIPKNAQSRLFERFYRAHVGTPYDFGGMGVGLYISREIIARHGGTMRFTSKEGKGSTFCFSLPLAPQGK